MTYIISFIIFGWSIYKVEWIRHFLLECSSYSFYHRILISILKVVLIFFLLYFIIWSILNYWFYINLIILHEEFHYNWLDSIAIASNLTDELSSGWYYFKTILNSVFGNSFSDQIMPELDRQIQTIVDTYGSVSEMNSGISFIHNFLKLI